MENLIRCYTMFDITPTGVATRSKPKENVDFNQWTVTRNQQANFDTIIQVISLRTQPDIIRNPESTKFNSKYFGNQYQDGDYKMWYFDFIVHHNEIYTDGNEKFGKLYYDFESIPMILINTEHRQLGNLIDISNQHRNIYFKELGNE